MKQTVSKPRVCKSSLSHVISSHFEENLQGSVLKNDSLLLVHIKNLIESRKKHPNNVLICNLNMHSLCYKVVDPGTLLTKFLPYYLVFAETKLDEGFPTCGFS